MFIYWYIQIGTTLLNSNIIAHKTRWPDSLNTSNWNMGRQEMNLINDELTDYYASLCTVKGKKKTKTNLENNQLGQYILYIL